MSSQPTAHSCVIIEHATRSEQNACVDARHNLPVVGGMMHIIYHAKTIERHGVGVEPRIGSITRWEEEMGGKGYVSLLPEAPCPPGEKLSHCRRSRQTLRPRHPRQPQGWAYGAALIAAVAAAAAAGEAGSILPGPASYRR